MPDGRVVVAIRDEQIGYPLGLVRSVAVFVPAGERWLVDAVLDVSFHDQHIGVATK